MRAFFVVLPPPRLKPFPRIGEGEEPGGVEEFRPEAAVERLAVGVVCGLAGLGKVDLHPVQVRSTCGPITCRSSAAMTAVMLFGSTIRQQFRTVSSFGSSGGLMSQARLLAPLRPYSTR